MTHPRPTPEQLAAYEVAWQTFLALPDEEAVRIRRLVKTDKAVAQALREQFVIGSFLEHLLTKLDAPSDFWQNACQKLGRACVGAPDAWAVFDFHYDQQASILEALTKNKTWAETPVSQDVPAPSSLLDTWYDFARRLVGQDGCYPHPFLRRGQDGNLVFETLAVEGNQAFAHVCTQCEKTHPVEFALGVDLYAMPGQDTAFADLLAVIWYVDGRFYTGVIDYQKLSDVPEGQEAEFRPIRWDNNYWNHALREAIIPHMIASVKKGGPL